MTDTYQTPPPPPPPPPPAQPPRLENQFDFLLPFTFVTKDRDWVRKILIGGVFSVASCFIIGIFFVFGYAAKLARNVVAGVEQPLPEWDDLGAYFNEGLRLFGVMFAYAIPFVIAAITFMIPLGIASEIGPRFISELSEGVMSLLLLAFIPFGFLLSFWICAALLFAAVEQNFSAAFDFSRIGRFIVDNIGNYILAFVVYLVARYAAGFGFFMCCIGIFFTMFWATMSATFAFAQVYRLSQTK